MIGISLHSRSRFVTSTPSMSGSIRSRIAAAGGCTAAAVERLLAAGRGRPPRSRHRAGSPAGRGGSAARRRRRGRGSRRSCPASARAAAGDDEARALPGQRLDRDLAAVGLDEPLGDRQAKSGAGVGASSPCWKGSKIRCHSPSGIPGPWSTTRTTIIAARPPASGLHRTAVAVAERVLEQVREGALELRRRRRRPSAARRRARAEPARGRPDPSPRRLQHLGEVDRLLGAARPSRPPAGTCRGGSRPGVRGGSPSPTIASLSSARSSAVRVAEPSAEPPAMIEVSGVRRSWEIERSSAVFSSSLRRSASASTASACIRSRSRVSASSSASARSASSRRRSASIARARASPATVLLTIAAITKRPGRPSSPRRRS